MNTFTRLASRAIGLVVLAAASIAASPAHADVAVPRLTVQYGDLDLGRSQGAATLYARLNAAASSVCSRGAINTDVRRKTEERLCREQAIARAVQGVDHPAFTAWYAAKSGRLANGALVASR
jgi:UrcA family protein